MTPYRVRLSLGLCLFSLVLVGPHHILGTLASAQTELQSDQFEPNNTREEAKFLPTFLGSSPGGGTAHFGQSANFHNGQDQVDWYKVKVMTVVAGGQYVLTHLGIGLIIPADGSYSLSVCCDSPYQGAPLTVTGSHDVALHTRFQVIGTLGTSSTDRTYYIEVRRSSAAATPQAYQLYLDARTTYLPPSITSFIPSSGPLGSKVEIKGSDYRDIVSVEFSGLPTNYTVISSTSISVTVPSGATTGPIKVRNMVGSAVSSQNFTVTSETAPPRKTGSMLSTTQGASPCCGLVANPALKGRLGRVVVAFPDGAVPKNTRVDVLKNGKVIQSGYGNQAWDLLSGTYEVKISGKQVPNVTVKAGHDTTVKVGVLRVSAGKDTKVDVLDAGNKLTSDYGDQVIGLPPGSFDIQVAGQTERVTISEGQVTDF